MSDTPRTDAYFGMYDDWMAYSKKYPNMPPEQADQCPLGESPAEFCAGLERELEAAHAVIAELREALESCGMYKSGITYCNLPLIREALALLPSDDTILKRRDAGVLRFAANVWERRFVFNDAREDLYRMAEELDPTSQR